MPVESNSTFAPANPEVVLEGNYFALQGGRSYDVSPDGERFLMITQVDDRDSELQIVVVQNWFEELKRLVPTE